MDSGGLSRELRYFVPSLQGDDGQADTTSV